MNNLKIGIIGGGTMGNGIAHVFSIYNFNVILVDINTIILDNEIEFRLNFVIRNTKAVQRKIDKESTVTNGNYNFQLRPNINYTVNNRVNLIIYYDRVVNKPIVSNSFPRYSSSFGARLRLSLNQ